MKEDNIKKLAQAEAECIAEHYGIKKSKSHGTHESKAATAFKPYLVRVSISDLNIRKGPGNNHSTIGKYTGKGVFTIVEEAGGSGATKGGLLKIYEEKRNGWISLDYVKKI